MSKGRTFIPRDKVTRKSIRAKKSTTILFLSMLGGPQNWFFHTHQIYILFLLKEKKKNIFNMPPPLIYKT